jgi:hypothetical protein
LQQHGLSRSFGFGFGLGTGARIVVTSLGEDRDVRVLRHVQSTIE